MGIILSIIVVAILLYWIFPFESLFFYLLHLYCKFKGEKFESVKAFIDELKRYIDYYNNERISLKLKGMSPVQYRTHSQAS